MAVWDVVALPAGWCHDWAERLLGEGTVDMRFGSGRVAAWILAGVMCSGPAVAAPVMLGAFSFDSALFGNSLIESDGGFRSINSFLNAAGNVAPGNPAVLTGVGFGTGVANIHLSDVNYTIGYASPIRNNAGADFGVVTARFSTTDTIRLTINATQRDYGPSLAVATGSGAYYFFGDRFHETMRYVTPIDLSDFGVAPGAGVTMINVTGAPELDLIRVAGFTSAAQDLPEPATFALLGLGVLGLYLLRRPASAA